jgi:hypothetical protein
MWQCGKWFVCSFGEHCEEVLSFLVILHHKVLIDEASQATETATLVPICHGCKQLVLCGDHCQLPPTVKSESPYSAGLKMSLFERLALYGLRPIMLNTQCLGAREELLLYEGPQGSSFSSEPVCQYLYYYFYFFIIYLSIYIYMILWYYTYVYAMHTFFTLADM